ncbi:MAG: hypothetical protein IPN88_14595 [Bacteroidetes bacterium]|nr:hypothetical protein [Bacteroidota bacterium]
MKSTISLLKFFFLIAFLTLSGFAASAQDTIYKRNKEIIQAKIIEIGLDEIKYKMPNYEDGPTIVIAKDQIWKIVFASGVTQLMTPEMFNPETYASQKKNALKTDFLAPMFHHITFIYEHSLKPGQSIEASLGIIGVGYNPDKGVEQTGAFVRFGFKFIKSPDFYTRGMKYAHILKGSYIRPEILFGSYSETNTYQEYNYYPYYYNTVTTINDRITYGAIQLSFGKQFVFDDSFLIDYYVGLGYAFSSHSVSNYESGIPYFGVTGGSSESPLSASGGLRIGFLIK